MQNFRNQPFYECMKLEHIVKNKYVADKIKWYSYPKYFHTIFDELVNILSENNNNRLNKSKAKMSWVMLRLYNSAILRNPLLWQQMDKFPVSVAVKDDKNTVFSPKCVEKFVINIFDIFYFKRKSYYTCIFCKSFDTLNCLNSRCGLI